MFRQIVQKELRSTDPTVLRKLRNDATAALTFPFALIPIDDCDEQVANNYNLHMRIGELRRRLEQYDMTDAFQILQFSPTVPDIPLPSTISLLDNWDGITEDMLSQHVLFLRRYGQIWDVQNLDWSLELMENSCEQALHNKIREDLLGCATWKSSGPYFFYCMIQRIVSSTEVAVMAMTDRIKSMKITSFPGEDVTVATGQLKMAILRLDTIQKLPVDINTHILKVMQTSSIKAFSSFFLQLEVNLKQLPAFNMSQFAMKPDAILALADRTYLDLKETSQWTKTTDAPAGFNADVSQCPPVDTDGGVASPTDGSNTKRKYWKLTPPTDGQSEEVVRNGKHLFWCAKCRRWNPTHKTTDHVSKKDLLLRQAQELLQQQAQPPTTTSVNSVTPSVNSDNTAPTLSSNGAMANISAYNLSNLRRAQFQSHFKKE